MNIAGTEYNLNHKALEIYISGCDGVCEDCHNPELWDYNIGKRYELWAKHFRQKLSTSMVENVWIMGGEPLLQPVASLNFFLFWLYKFKKPIMLWTRFEIQDIPEDILQYLKYVKVGKYLKDSNAYVESIFGVELASKNQEIIKL